MSAKPRALAPQLTSPQLAKALSHPTRVRILTALNDRIASPKQLAAMMGEALNHVSYHVEVLTRLGCIEMVDAQPSSGGRVVEHFYKATQRSFFDEEAWNQLGEHEKQTLTAAIMRMMSQDVNEAMAKGTFFEPDDNHLSRTPLTVDTEGWREVKEILESTLYELLAVKENVLKRGSDPEEMLHAKVEIIHFRSPSPEGSP